MSEPTTEEVSWPELHRVRRAIVVVDVVESVRLMQAHEADVIDRWRRFVAEVRTQVLPRVGGRLVKSLGDGLLLEFELAPAALASAYEMQRCITRYNVDRAADAQIALRVGVHLADVVVDDIDVYGAGVNLAARLATLAGPGEVVISADMRDACIEGYDGEFEDLGEVYLKHLSAPVHAIRACAMHSAITQHGLMSAPDTVDLSSTVPTIAVMPFSVATEQGGVHLVIGELIADGVLAQLAVSDHMRVISRLSSSALHERKLSCQEIGSLLSCDYVLSGRCVQGAGRVLLIAELAETRDSRVVWSDRLATSQSELLQPNDPVTRELAVHASAAVVEHELRRVGNSPLPTLRSFSLQLAGISLMHRSPRHDFARAGEVFDALVERHPRAAGPRALMAQWHVLRVTRGLADDVLLEARRALQHTRRAREDDPDNAFALAVEGFVHCHMLKDLDAAQERIDAALILKPNEPLAWLYRCVVQGFRGEGDAAWASAQRAIALSPLDPMRPYVDGLAASAALAAGLLPAVVELAERALRANRDHLPTLRALAIARVEQGELAMGRELAARVLKLDPGLTVKGYLDRAPKGSGGYTRERYAAALRTAGIPP